MSPPTSCKRQHTRARAHEGMALMLVLLLIVMVTAAGVFAAQSTAFEIRSSGFLRQASQTHYVAQSGVIASLDEMRTYCSAYVGLMRQQVASGTVMRPAWAAEPPLQWHFELSDFSARYAGGGIFLPATPGMGGLTPGSLGATALQPGFRTDATILAEVPTPMVGFGVGGGRDFSVPMMAIQYATNGQTSLAGIVNMYLPTSGGNVTAVEQARMIAQVPCL